MGVALGSVVNRLARRLGGNGISVAVLVVAIAIGGGLTFWARSRLDVVLMVRPSAEIGLALEAIEGDCGTPAFYVQPIAAGQATNYEVLLDALGGTDRFPDFGGTAATAVIALPESRRPGVGLGRGLLARCDAMTLALSGDFAGVRMTSGPGSAVTVEEQGPGVLRLTYRRPDPPDPDAALAGFVLEGVPDDWQFGHKRVRFANAGPLGINVFLYEEPDYLFLNENFAFVRPPNVRRSYADIHLERMGGQFASSADVVRRRPTSDSRAATRPHQRVDDLRHRHFAAGRGRARPAGHPCVRVPRHALIRSRPAPAIAPISRCWPDTRRSLRRRHRRWARRRP